MAATAVLAALAVAVLLLGPPTPSEAEDDPSGVEALRPLVSELIRLELEAAAEETSWNEQRAHLETSRALLERERDDLRSAAAGLREEIEALAADGREDDERISGAEEVLAAADRAARECAARLLEVHAGFPGALRLPLDGAADRVREALENPRTEAIERLRVVAAFASDLDRAQSSVHAVKELVDLGEGGRREVDALYLGATVGYWVDPDGGAAGLLLPGEDGWTPHRRDELAAEVKRALAIHRKEQPADLVTLPLSAEWSR
jgi:hypothetical protein